MSIGWTPSYEPLNLNRGDFIYSRTSPRLLPAGTTAEIKWANGVTWPAIVVDSTVSWRVESENCTAAIIPHGTSYDMFIRYPNPDTETEDDFHWKYGRADRSPLN
ncbi:hypothetical protein ABZ413_29510 [Nocardia rhamnosiphila]|uniref:LtfC-like domain-containing protein n=1 Tax=Nocardia rhamnosiphila TaxID=426716 RepID=UPI0033D0A323